MADDAAVVVTLRADLKGYEAALKSAVRATEKAAAAAEKAVSNVGKSGGASNVIQANFSKSAGAIANDARVLQFQLNDIFSGIASGQGIRAVQQQLGQIAQQMSGGSLAAGARTFGTALIGMVNPINLAVVAFGVLATVAASYFSSSEEDAAKATKELEKQASTLEDLAKKYGQLFPELNRAAQNLRDQADAAGLAAAKQKALDAAYVDSQKTVDDLTGTMVQLSGALLDLKVSGDAVAVLESNWTKLQTAIDAHTASGKELQPILAALEKLMQSNNQTVEDLATTIHTKLVASFAELERAAKSAGETIQNSLNFSMPGAGGPLDLGPLTGQNRAALLDKSLAGAADAIDGFTERVIQAESGGRANAANPNSTAVGAGQFLKSTWLEVFKRNFASEAAGMSDAAILALRGDLETNRRMIRAYATENARDLKDAGQDVTEATLQLAHFLGSGGAVKILQAAPGTKVANIPGMGAAIAANPSILGGGATREDVLAYAERRTRAEPRTKEEKKNYDELVTSINDKVAAQQRENEITADYTLSSDEKTSALQREKAAQEAAKVELELNNAAQAQGIPLTDELKAKNHDLAQSYAAAGLQADQLSTAQAKAAKSAEESAALTKQINQQMAGILGGALSGFVQDLMNGEDAGDAFNNMLKRMIGQLADMAIQLLVVKPLMDALGGGGTSGGGILGGLFGVAHQGGVVGRTQLPMRLADPRIFTNAPRFATGGMVGLRPGEVPIIAHRGETIIPRGRRIGGDVHNDVGDINIDMSGTGLVASSSESGKLLGRQIQAAVQVVLVQESRPGGILRRPT
jgi:hypothetical protein